MKEVKVTFTDNGYVAVSVKKRHDDGHAHCPVSTCQEHQRQDSTR